MINILYSILIGDNQDSSSWYNKRHSGVVLSERGISLRQALVGAVPASGMPMVACALSYMAISSPFSAEILKRDPENTYAALNSSTQLFSPLARYIGGEAGVSRYLDKDLRAELVLPSMFDLTSAASVQLLREASNG